MLVANCLTTSRVVTGSSVGGGGLQPDSLTKARAPKLRASLGNQCPYPRFPARVVIEPETVSLSDGKKYQAIARARLLGVPRPPPELEIATEMVRRCPRA